MEVTYSAFIELYGQFPQKKKKKLLSNAKLHDLRPYTACHCKVC